MSVLQKLTEGITSRSLQREGAALLDKWEATGLLEGITDDSKKSGMARLLENQASQLLKEASSMAAGDVEGFASVAFPIVRRVFGGLLANDLVSVQPMSLPSGLIFFLDFTYEGGDRDMRAGQSVYGGAAVGAQITGGVSLTHGDAPAVSTVADQETRDGDTGFYNLRSGYSAATGTFSIAGGSVGVCTAIAGTNWTAGFAAATAISAINTDSERQQVDYDPDLLNISDTADNIVQVDVTVTDAQLAQMDKDNLMAMDLRPQTANVVGVLRAFGGDGDEAGLAIRRLTRWVSRSDVATTTKQVATAATDSSLLRFTVHGNSNLAFADVDVAVFLDFPLQDNFDAAGAVGAVVGADNWPLEEPDPGTGKEGSPTGKHEIGELDIKVDSIAVTAQTKKLKAKWSPELGQDLNAYHNLDAEVELTQILSEHIALEIDREILNDLVSGAKAATYYWSRSPGLFVNRETGAELGATAAAPDFTGTVSEWYETLIETINDVSAQIHRKTLRGGANFLVTSPEVANILEFTAGFRASVTADADKGTVGAVNVGSVSKKWDVWVDPYFPRNLVLVGRKGGSFLESGYVYAPYVPLQVTPTIFGTEDFVPRKGVMTRYAKKMVRPDMYGLVIVRGLLGESGS